MAASAMILVYLKLHDQLLADYNQALQTASSCVPGASHQCGRWAFGSLTPVTWVVDPRVTDNAELSAIQSQCGTNKNV